MENRVSADASSRSADGTKAESSKLSFFEKVGYGVGDTASNFYWQTFLNFLSFFYTDVFGLGPQPRPPCSWLYAFRTRALTP